MQADAIVIGRGIAGLATAYELVKAGFKVMLLGPRKTAASGSWAAIGAVTLKAQIQPRKTLFSFKTKAHRDLYAWCEELAKVSGVAIGHSQGVWEPFFDETSYRRIRQRVFHGSLAGLNPYEVLVAKEFTSFIKGAEGAFYYPQDYWLDVDGIIKALETFLKNHHCVEFVDALVIKIKPLEKQDVSEVVCQERSFLAQKVVLAAGVGSANVLENSGFHTAPLKVLWGQSFFVPSTKLPDGVYLFGKKTLVTHGGKLWWGSKDYKIRPSTGEIAAGLEDAKSELQKWGLLGQNVEIKSRLGARLFTADRSPCIGSVFLPHSQSSLWLNTAHYKNGVQFAPLAARMVAAAITAKANEKSIHTLFTEAFSPRRYTW